jgi:hypothetical protein
MKPDTRRIIEDAITIGTDFRIYCTTTEKREIQDKIVTMVGALRAALKEEDK